MLEPVGKRLLFLPGSLGWREVSLEVQRVKPTQSEAKTEEQSLEHRLTWITLCLKLSSRELIRSLSGLSQSEL